MLFLGLPIAAASGYLALRNGLVRRRFRAWGRDYTGLTAMAAGLCALNFTLFISVAVASELTTGIDANARNAAAANPLVLVGYAAGPLAGATLAVWHRQRPDRWALALFAVLGLSGLACAVEFFLAWIWS